MTSPIQQNVLKITSVHPEWWYQALRLHTDAKLGTNKKLNLRMRFDKDILEDVSSGEQRPDITTFQVVIRLGGIGVGETEVIFRDETSGTYTGIPIPRLRTTPLTCRVL